jgi:hypothetical protein
MIKIHTARLYLSTQCLLQGEHTSALAQRNTKLGPKMHLFRERVLVELPRVGKARRALPMSLHIIGRRFRSPIRSYRGSVRTAVEAPPALGAVQSRRSVWGA